MHDLSIVPHCQDWYIIMFLKYSLIYIVVVLVGSGDMFITDSSILCKKTLRELFLISYIPIIAKQEALLITATQA